MSLNLFDKNGVCAEKMIYTLTLGRAEVYLRNSLSVIYSVDTTAVSHLFNSDLLHLTAQRTIITV